MNVNDWRPGVEEKLGFYVYLLVDPRDGSVFYVGKGTGGRCFAHVREANITSRSDSHGYTKLEQIREIEAGDLQVRIDVLQWELTESEALLVEAATIDVLGIEQLTNRVLGHGSVRRTAGDINALLGATPAVFTEDDRLVLIRVSRLFRSGMPDSELYEVTRKWWKMGERRTAATHALAVYAGVVRGAYAIHEWERPDAAALTEDPSREGRWAFIGPSDEAMLDRFLFTDVNAEFSQGNQTPFKYVGF